MTRIPSEAKKIIGRKFMAHTPVLKIFYFLWSVSKSFLAPKNTNKPLGHVKLFWFKSIATRSESKSLSDSVVWCIGSSIVEIQKATAILLHKKHN